MAIQLSGDTPLATQTELDAKSPQMATAWVSFDNTGLIYDSYNVSSITVNNPHSFTVNLAVEMDNNNYATTFSYPEKAGGYGILSAVASTTTTTVNILFRNADSPGSNQAVGAGKISIAIFGGKA